MIASYALCGFSSIVTVGIIMAVLVALDPNRRADISGMAMRALVNGNVVCFLTACVEGKKWGTVLIGGGRGGGGVSMKP